MRRTLVALLWIIGISVVVYAASYVVPTRVDYETAPRAEVERYFLKQIEQYGGQMAYRRFSADVAPIAAERQHVLAHIFGDALFEVDGLQGITACDARFIYGCFHEVIARTIAKFGLSQLSAVYDACVNTPGEVPRACLHGLGHGVIATLGYSKDELSAALYACDSLSGGQIINWCYWGVFMEYNQRVMLGPDQGRDADPHSRDLYEPCISLDQKYQKMCVWELPPWWHRALLSGDGTEDAFKVLGEYCESSALRKDLVRTCFEGIGNMTTPLVEYDPRRTAVLCETASRKSLYQLFCKSAAALSFSSSLHDTTRAEQMCDSLQQGAFEFCLGYAHNKANIMNPLPAPAL